MRPLQERLRQVVERGDDIGERNRALMAEAALALDGEEAMRASLLSKLSSWRNARTSLPKLSEEVLFVTECGTFFLGSWDGIRWTNDEGRDIVAETVTHWMPLPEPPK